jgi:hypothetical protein
MWACVMGDVVCVGGGGGTAEICNGLDDDCNGMVDDIPGKGAPCTDNGGSNVGNCRAHYICDPAVPGSGPFGLTCNPEQAPEPEICDGEDNDCDGKTDETNDPGPMNDVLDNDPTVGTPCDVPMAPKDKPPCMAGTLTCRGAVGCNPDSVACAADPTTCCKKCEGAVKPIEPNVCGQPATDCTGNPGTVCPPGAVCYMGMCVTECANSEFPCPGGFRCDRTLNLCLPDVCTRLNCTADQICRINSDGTASCVDPCVGVNCPTGFRCRAGACIDDSCRTFGCPAGQMCRGTPPSCRTDPCATMTCNAGQYCDAGSCKMLCTTPCLSGQACVDGVCVQDPCETKTCTADKVCTVIAGVPMCVDNSCLNMACGSERVCCGGACVDDPCLNVTCPDPYMCVRTSACTATCTVIGTQNAEERIVGAGGGGAACSMSGRGGSAGGDGALVLLFAATALWLRRRRAGEVR